MTSLQQPIGSGFDAFTTAQDVIAEEAQRCGMFHVNERWLGTYAADAPRQA